MWGEKMQSSYENVQGVSSVLKLNNLVFDSLSFKREDFHSEQPLETKFSFRFLSEQDQNIVVSVRVEGEKSGEYHFRVQISGYFELDEQANKRDVLIRQNAVAILFPYLRSQVSLLTTQPGVEPVILPPLNIAKMVEQAISNHQAAEDSNNP